MGNPAKHMGTDYESACVNYLRTVAGIEVARVAPGGAKDRGDLLAAIHGRPITIECKRVERVTPSALAEFRLQTTVESQNAGTEGGVLLMWRKGKGYRWDASPTGQRAKSFGENVATMTVETMLKVMGAEGDVGMPSHALDTWVTMAMADFALCASEWEGR